MTNNKSAYIDYCNQNNVPLFNKPWWLNAVVGENWDCVIATKKDKVLGFLPYVLNTSNRFKSISLPLLTQFVEPVVLYPNNQKYSKRLSFDKDVLTSLYEELPKSHFIKHTWSYKMKNWLPLYWMGYEQSTRYTYVLEDISDHKAVFDNFETKIRGDVRKAEKQVKIHKTDDADVIYDLVSKTFARKKITMPYQKVFFKKVVAATKTNNCGQIYYAQDDADNIHAAVFIVWDEETAFYLLGGGDEEYRNSGATSLLLWNAIKVVSEKVNRFDFEGSMIEPIERFVRGFGAKQTELKTVHKINTKSYFIFQKFKETIKFLKK